MHYKNRLQSILRVRNLVHYSIFSCAICFLCSKNNFQKLSTQAQRTFSKNAQNWKQYLDQHTKPLWGHTQLNLRVTQGGFYNFYWPLPFEKSFIKDTKGNQPNILCHHARWNKNPMKELMALDSVFITILRNPVTQFESTFSYMGFAHLFGIETGRDSIEAFITDPNGIMAKFANSSPAENVFPYLNLLKNGQFFDLGLDSIYFHDEEKVNMAIDEIARNFNLVLLMEYFDESLVLLANEACWDVRDVVYFKLNQRKSADKEDKFSNELVEKIRLWNRADVLLYDYFNKTFWNQIKKLGSAFKADVERLRYYNEVLRESCLVPGEYNTKAYTKQARPVRGYALKENLDTPLKTLCEKMITNELDYLQLLTGRHSCMYHLLQQGLQKCDLL